MDNKVFLILLYFVGCFINAIIFSFWLYKEYKNGKDLTVRTILIYSLISTLSLILTSTFFICYIGEQFLKFYFYIDKKFKAFLDKTIIKGYDGND